jgi:hypothetical protein
VESNGLPISIVIGSANNHDSTKFVDVMESVSEYFDDQMITRSYQFMQTKDMMQNTSECI